MFDKNKAFHGISFASLGLVVVGLMAGIAWTVYPYETVTINDFSLIQHEYYPGEDFVINWDVCAHRDMSIDYSYVVVNGVADTIATRSQEIQKGCSNHQNVRLPVPNLVPGEYHLEYQVSYNVTPIRSISAIIDVGSFTISSYDKIPESSSSALPRSSHNVSSDYADRGKDK